jgi:tetratricopeptide (TPR) repeat protein
MIRGARGNVLDTEYQVTSQDKDIVTKTEQALSRRIAGYFLCFCFSLTLFPGVRPAEAQSWSSWKQLAQEQLNKGQLAACEESWRAAYNLVRESGAKDSRLYLSVLGLAQVLKAEGKVDEAFPLLKSVCSSDLLNGPSEEAVSCLKFYIELTKEKGNGTESDRAEKLLQQLQAKSSKPEAEKSVSLLFGEAAENELRKKLPRAQQFIAQKNYPAAEAELSEALQIATNVHNPKTVIKVLTEQAKLYSLLSDAVKAEVASKKLLDQIKIDVGIENQRYVDALSYHAKLLRLKGDNALAQKEEQSCLNLVEIIKSKRASEGITASSAVPASVGTVATTPSSAARYDPSSMSSSYQDDGVSLAELMAKAEGSNDIGLLKFLFSALYRRRDYARCLPYAQRLASLQPDEPKYQLILSSVFMQLKRADQAIEPAKRAVQLAPSAESYSNLIAVYADSGDMNNQLQALKYFVSRFPDHPNAEEFKGEIRSLEKAIAESDATASGGSAEKEQRKCWKNRVAMPIKVFLVDNAPADQLLKRSDGSNPRHPRELCQESLDLWTAASGGSLSFQVVRVPTEANITIGYSFRGDGILGEHCAAGLTKWEGNLSRATVYVGLVDKNGYRVSQETFISTALHEIGHALGLEHSSGADDVMFWQERTVCPTTLSANDQRRIVSLYCR